MIAALITSWALISNPGDAESPAALNPGEACRIAMEDAAPEGNFAIRGEYFADGRHGGRLELPECEATLSPDFETGSPFYNRIRDYHWAFADKCGAMKMGDYISGVFTGRFVRKRAQLFDMQKPSMVVFFVVSDVDSGDQDPGKIVCPK